MKVGLIARSEDRGLGLQTWELYRNLRPDVTTVIDMGAAAGGFPMHLERYGIRPGRYEPGVGVAKIRHGRLADSGDVHIIRHMLEQCDVVYTAETFYDDRVPVWAAELDCRVVVHINPEFHRGTDFDGAEAVRWWAPTSWRIDQLPEGTRVVPVPVAGDRFTLEPTAPAEGPLRVLHVIGHRAGNDRNGTLGLLRALRNVKAPLSVTLATQDAAAPLPQGLPGHVALNRLVGGVVDYWDLYRDHDVLVMPRRYGGLCLPVQEAMAAGLAVVMSDTSPNGEWPVMLVPTSHRQDLQTPGGWLRCADVSALGLAGRLTMLALDWKQVLAMKQASVGWARAHTWEQLGDVYRDELAAACR